MKNIFSLSFVISFIFFLSSCKPQHINFSNNYKEGKVIITVDASKISPLDPWAVDLSAKVYGFEKGSLHFEQQAKTLSETTIKFDWKDENTCIISFPDDDGSIRKFQLIASAKQFYLAELSAE